MVTEKSLHGLKGDVGLREKIPCTLLHLQITWHAHDGRGHTSVNLALIIQLDLIY